VEALAGEAQARYAEGRYPEAIKLYLQAWQLSPEAALLFNVAVIYDQQVRDPDIALEYYRKYVTAPDADPEAVVQATARIEALKAGREQAAAAAATAPAPSPAEPRPAPPAERDTPVRTILAWSLVGLGGALAVGGTVAGVMAQADDETFRQSSDVVSKRDLRDRGETRALAADVMFATAGAAVIGGVVLLLTGGGEDEPAATGAHLVPVAGGALGVLRF
jgi:tetratricopeptide (TPR) repeat protein